MVKIINNTITDVADAVDNTDAVNLEVLETAIAAYAPATIAIADDTTTDATMYPVWVTADTGDLPVYVSSTEMTFNPSTGLFSATGIAGDGSGLTGDAASLNAGTATALETSHTIGGVSFDGTADIVPQTIQSVNEATDTTCYPLFISDSGSQSLQPLNNAGFTYDSNTNNLTCTTFTGAVTGNAATATALQTARNIGGVSFNGTADIVPQTIQSINEATDTTCFPLFISASGSQSLQPLNNVGFTYNSNTNALTATTFIGALTGNATTATALATARAIYGNNFNGTAALTQIIASTFGGTGNGFAKFSGPTTAEKTFTLPDASATILTDNSAVTAAQGGTGIASYAVGDLLYASGATTFSKLADVATGNVLISGGVTTAPSWGKIGLTTHVSGTLGAANGGTGVANNATSTITISGNFGTTLTVTGTTAVTLPTSGTLTTLATVVSTANTFTKAQSSAPVAVTSTSNSIATDASLSNVFTHTLTENTTLANPTNLVSGTYYTWIVTQAASAKTLAFGNKFKFPGGTAMVVSTGNAAVDTLTSYYDGTNLNTVFSQNFS